MIRNDGVVSELNQWIHNSSFLFPARLVLRMAGPEEAKNSSGKRPPPDSDPLSDTESEKISPSCQNNSPRSRNAVSLSSARALKRFPSSR